MSAIWIAVIGASLTAFLNKYIGHSVPEKWLNRPSFMRINALVPIVLLSALVGVQTFANKKELVFDQRFAGVLVSLVALKFKAPFPVVVISAAITSAAIYNWFYRTFSASSFSFTAASDGSVRCVPSENRITGIDRMPPFISITFSEADTSASTSM